MAHYKGCLTATLYVIPPLWGAKVMMGEFYKVEQRPRCCACGAIAVGRICYMGSRNKVVDNPFCNQDFGEIFKQTGKLMDELYGLKIDGDWVYIQRWKYTDILPAMPTSRIELIEKGNRRR